VTEVSGTYSTDSHLAFAAGLREAMADAPDEVDPAAALRRGREEMSAIVERRIRLFRWGPDSDG
jgi:fructose/tagatose bisphosphate aldolase